MKPDCAMKTYRVCVVLILLFTLAFAETASGFNKVGRTTLQFLKIGIGARQVGLGEASLAVVRDVNAIYWNPANTTGINSAEASFSYASWFADLNYITGAVGYRWQKIGVFTLGYASLDYGDIPEALVSVPSGSSDTRTGNTFTGGDLMLGFSFAREFTDNLSIGVGLKYIYEKLFDYSVDQFAFDIGTYYDTGFNGLKIAMTVQNFGSSVRFLENSDREVGYDIPFIFRIGLSANLVGYTDGFFAMGDAHKLQLSLDALHSNDYAERMHIGAEYWYNDMLALRSGYKFNYEEGNWSVGIGLKQRIGSVGVRMDYAYTHFEFLESPHRFSLSFSF
jgi:hypothetical protein